MRTWLRRLAIVAALVAAVVLLRLTVLAPEAVPVTVFRVAAGRVEETVTNSKAGTIRTRQRASLAPEIGGRVAEILVSKGDTIEAGQVILRLSDADLRAEALLRERSLDAARASRRQSCVAAEQAERDLARTEALARDAIVSRGVLEQAQSARDTARAACEAAGAAARQAEAAVELARATLAKAEMRAPFAGVVAEKRVEVGEWVTPSPPAMLVPGVIDLIDMSSIYVSAPLDEVDAGKVSVGQVVRVTVDPFPGEAFPGRVTRVAPYVVDVQDQNRTFEIECELDDAATARRLMPGTTADVEIVQRAKDGVLRVPSYALLQGGKVLRLAGSRLEEVGVETGLKNWEFTEIVSGLAAGDAVVVSLDRAEVKAGARASVAGETTK